MSECVGVFRWNEFLSDPPNNAPGIGCEGREKQGWASGESDLAPRRVLWVVVVTTSACLKGEGITLAATKPLMWAMSARRCALTSSQTWAGGETGLSLGRARAGLPKAAPLANSSTRPSTNLSHSGIVDEASIGAGASYDKPRPEKSSSDCQLVVVNKASFRLNRQTKS